MAELTIDAALDQLETVLEFVNGQMEAVDVPRS